MTDPRVALYGLNISCNLSLDPEARSLCGKLGLTVSTIGAIHEYSGWGERHKKNLEEEVRRKRQQGLTKNRLNV